MASQKQVAASDTKQEAYLLRPRRHQRKMRPHIQRRKKRLFLEAFGQHLTVTHAAEAADIDRGTHYIWLKDDPQYAQEFLDLEERKVEFLEQQTYKRGAVGWEEPVFHQGEVCGHIRRFSDACAIFMLKAARPEKYRERYEFKGSVEHSAVIPLNAVDQIVGRALELREAQRTEVEGLILDVNSEEIANDEPESNDLED